MRRNPIMMYFLFFIAFMLFSCSTNHDVYQDLIDRQTEANESLHDYESMLNDTEIENRTLTDKIAEVPQLSDYDLQLFNEKIYTEKASVSYTGESLQDEIIRGTYIVSDYEIVILYSSGLLLKGNVGAGGNGEMYFIEGSYDYDKSNNQLTLDYGYQKTVFIVEFKDYGLNLFASDIDNCSYDCEWIRYE